MLGNLTTTIGNTVSDLAPRLLVVLKVKRPAYLIFDKIGMYTNYNDKPGNDNKNPVGLWKIFNIRTDGL